MQRRVSLGEYFRMPESNRPAEVAYGVLREPPAPFARHQRVVLRLAMLLGRHVDRVGAGQLLTAPIDVVLEPEPPLVVQPDLVFISRDRAGIIRDRIHGAPDLVIEVLSPGMTRHDRVEKLGWYQRYGAREYWLVNPAREEIEVIAFESARIAGRRLFGTSERVRSRVLPRLRLVAASAFRRP
jgi:Uma2 family endonuclease